MKIIDFPSVQRNQTVTVTSHPKPTSLLLRYREGMHGEFLVWAICVVCALASIVLSVSQLQNDVNRVRRTQFDRISVSDLAEQTPCAVEVSKRL
jgi:hypothetical protein